MSSSWLLKIFSTIFLIFLHKLIVSRLAGIVTYIERIAEIAGLKLRNIGSYLLCIVFLRWHDFILHFRLLKITQYILKLIKIQRFFIYFKLVTFIILIFFIIWWFLNMANLLKLPWHLSFRFIEKFVDIVLIGVHSLTAILWLNLSCSCRVYVHLLHRYLDLGGWRWSVWFRLNLSIALCFSTNDFNVMCSNLQYSSSSFQWLICRFDQNFCSNCHLLNVWPMLELHQIKLIDSISHKKLEHSLCSSIKCFVIATYR